MITLSSLDPIVSARSLLNHPFYQRWSKGELTLDELRIYAKEYFHLVERIPDVVEHISERTQDASFKAECEHNRAEEQEHVELWKRFARSLGISEAELVSYEPSQTVRNAVADIESLAERSFDDGVAAMYALELELPKIAATKKEGLCDFYGLKSEDAQIYFDEHLKEEAHLQVWRSRMVSDNAQESAAKSIDAQNRVLDGVCEACGIPLHC